MLPTIIQLHDSLKCSHSGDGDALEATKAKNEGTIKTLKGDVENLNMALDKAETEKKTKDGQIQTLNDEMARQDEAVGYLQYC